MVRSPPGSTGKSLLRAVLFAGVFLPMFLRPVGVGRWVVDAWMRLDWSLIGLVVGCMLTGAALTLLAIFLCMRALGRAMVGA